MRVCRVVIQGIGATVIFLSVWGFYWGMVAFQRGVKPLSPSLNSQAPYYRTVFLLMNAIEAIFLMAFVIIAVSLLRMKSARPAVSAYTWISISLVIYTFLLGCLWGLNSPIGSSIATATGLGCIALAPLLNYPAQYVYLAVTVVLANFAMWRLRRLTSATFPAPGTSRLT
jgi:hypothetical protein